MARLDNRHEMQAVPARHELAHRLKSRLSAMGPAATAVAVSSMPRTVTARAVRVTDPPVMMLDLAVVKLKHQNPVGEQSAVLWAAVVAA